MSAADLHTHTLASDGTTTPAENVRLAAAAGLQAVAITDHDTTAGWDEAMAAGRRWGIEVIGGIELSTEHDGAGIHLLGYWLDPADPDLVAECARLRGERWRRARTMIARLQQAGVSIDAERVQALAGDAPVGRPHLAAALVEAGVVADTDAAFVHYLGEGAPAYEPKRAVSPVAGVRLIRAAGGVAVLAHPGLSGAGARPGAVGSGAGPGPEGSDAAAERAAGGVPVALLDALTEAGLAGVECDHPAHPPAVRDRWRALADARDLQATGSSDFHGARKDAAIGACVTPAGVLAALRARSGSGLQRRARSSW